MNKMLEKFNPELQLQNCALFFPRCVYCNQRSLLQPQYNRPTGHMFGLWFLWPYCSSVISLIMMDVERKPGSNI